jgi:outer membrane murein-binding lipoprotein Lpp
MDDEGTTVTVDYEVTDTTMIETDPLVAPAGEDSSGDGYNVTIIGTWFAQDEGANLDFVLYNDTEEWDLDVYQESGFNPPRAEITNEEDEGEFEAWWEVLTDLSIGTYTLNVTDEYDLFAQYILELVPKTVDIDPRKSSFRIGDTVAFTIEHSFGTPGSYIKIWDPSGNLYWQTDAFMSTMWIKVGSIVRLPYFAQVAGGNPMTLLDDAPLGTWEWTWYDGDDELDTGTFEVSEAESDVLAGQVQDLNNQITDLADQVSSVSDDFDDVRSDIQDVAAIAQQAVTAAQAATEAVQTLPRQPTRLTQQQKTQQLQPKQQETQRTA